MEIHAKSLNEKLHSEREKFFKKIDEHRRFQEKIDFVLENEWLNQQDQAIVSIHVSTLFNIEVNISISNVDSELFIENVLGPYHRKYNINWTMSVDGSPEEPVLEFKEENYNWTNPKHPTFRVKEGQFKVCKFVKEVVSFTKPREAEPVYRTKMICE